MVTLIRHNVLLFRYPYSTAYGERSCCGSKTFMVNDATCCADGTISNNNQCKETTTKVWKFLGSRSLMFILYKGPDDYFYDDNGG